MSSNQEIAIIGAGLSGLSLALALSQQGIPCTLYENRPAPLDIGGAIMLSPNALKILDKLGVYEQLKGVSYPFEHLYFRSDDDKLVDTFEFGSSEKYGYPGQRVYRYELINILLAMVRDAGVPIKFGKKFEGITSETEDGVTWQFADGSEASAKMLVGADGIHSRVRKYIYPEPEMQPKFTNMCGITAAVPTKQLGIEGKPDQSKLPVTFMNKTHGAFVIAPQLPDGSEMLIGKQYRFEGPEPDREGWQKLHEDKTWCIDFLRQGNDAFPSIVGQSTSHINPSKINLWPFYLLPKLASWTSDKKHSRVVLLGDSAHAIPPTAGQGVNQAFEDVYTFAGVVGALKRNNTESASALKEALRKWYAGRQGRVDQVIELNNRLNKRRLPPQDGEELDLTPFEMGWLFDVDFEEMVAGFVAE